MFGNSRSYAIVVEEIARQFSFDASQIKPETSAADVDGWDSLSHVTLMMRIEKRLGTRLSASQVREAVNVGELTLLLDRTLNRT